MILALGSYVSIYLIRSLASVVIGFHSGPAKETTPNFTLSKISLSLSPPKGGFPLKRMKRMTPMLHTSHFSL